MSFTTVPDPKEFAKQPTTPKPQLAKKDPMETHSQFQERMEKKGIARRCNHCGGNRRYALVQCPYCNQYEFHQVEAGTPKDPVEGEERAPSTHLDPAASPDGNYAFSPAEGVDAADSPNAITQQSGAAVGDTTPLADRTVVQLKNLAATQEISLGSAKTKADIIDAIQQHYGAPAPPASPTPDVPVHDKEGLDASQKTPQDPNELTDQQIEEANAKAAEGDDPG